MPDIYTNLIQNHTLGLAVRPKGPLGFSSTLPSPSNDTIHSTFCDPDILIFIILSYWSPYFKSLQNLHKR